MFLHPFFEGISKIQICNYSQKKLFQIFLTQSRLFTALNPTICIKKKNLKNPLNVYSLTLSRLGGSVFSIPPLWFLLNNLNTSYIRTLKLLHFFNIIYTSTIYNNKQILLKNILFWCKGYGGGWKNGGSLFKKNQKCLITFLLIKLQG